MGWDMREGLLGWDAEVGNARAWVFGCGGCSVLFVNDQLLVADYGDLGIRVRRLLCFVWAAQCQWRGCSAPVEVRS